MGDATYNKMGDNYLFSRADKARHAKMDAVEYAVCSIQHTGKRTADAQLMKCPSCMLYSVCCVLLLTRMLDLKKQQSRAQGIRSSFIVDSFIVEHPDQETSLSSSEFLVYRERGRSPISDWNSGGAVPILVVSAS